jgi:hypothetical protein
MINNNERESELVHVMTLKVLDMHTSWSSFNYSARFIMLGFFLYKYLLEGA